MSRIITLPCGHPYELPEGDPPPEGTVVCALCSSDYVDPPPPRQILSGAAALGQRLGAPGRDVAEVSTVQEESGRKPTAEWPRVPGYEVIGVLGQGGMGIVYAARQVGLNRTVALKMILSGRYAGAEELARFRREATAAGRLQHPHIVQIHEIGEHEGRPYFSLEYVDGGSLAQRLNGAPVPPGEAAALVETLARAMQCAHQMGIVHRDLKPANILLAACGPAVKEVAQPQTAFTPKIADFGLAKQLDDGSGPTGTGAILGTPSYMSPEQATGQSRVVGPLVDVYALGAILYEMLTGRPPFRGTTFLDTLEQVRSQEPVPPRQLQPKVPRDVETICLKCLRKEPGRRYASAVALAEDLRRFLNHEPIQARPVGRAEKLVRWCRRNPRVAGLLAALTVVLASGFGGVTWKWREADQERRRADAKAEAETTARRNTARALNYVAASYIAATLNDLSSDGGKLMTRVRKRPEAIRAFEQACALGEQVLANDGDARVANAVAKSYAQLSVLQAAAGQADGAFQSCGRSLALLAESAAEPVESLEQQTELGHTFFVLGGVYRILDKNEEAIPVFRQAVAKLRAVLAEGPHNAKARLEVSKAYYNLAHVQRQANHLAESAATSLERQQLWPDNADEIYDVACELALCAARVAEDKAEKQLTDSERSERQHFADQALGVLRQAVASGLKGASAVRRDPNLALLHGRNDFEQLVDELAKKESAEKK